MVHCWLSANRLAQDSYLEAAFSEEQLLKVPLVPEGTEYQAQCVFRTLVPTHLD